MPKRTASRSISERGEKNLAKRIERERTARGWSYETLAKKMTAVGCAISKAALYSIEQGDPPRRITVDELMAFAEVFAYGDVAELLTPVEVLEKRVAHALIERLAVNVRQAEEIAVETFVTMMELDVNSYHNRELWEYVWNQVEAMGERGLIEIDVDARVTEEELERLAEIQAQWRYKIAELSYSRSREVFEGMGLPSFAPAWTARGD